MMQAVPLPIVAWAGGFAPLFHPIAGEGYAKIFIEPHESA
jgi:hypothetical protein